jgi:hypothetical protein
MSKRGLLLLTIGAFVAGCGGSSGNHGSSGNAGASGTTGVAGSAGGATAGAGGGATAGTGGGGSSGGSAGGATAGTSGTGGTTGGAGGGAAGQSGGGASGTGAGGARDGGMDAAGTGGGTTSDAAPGPSFLPAGYTGTPFTANRIPGRINACDYDRGGAGVAWCHSPGNCAGGTVTGDYPGGSGVYRTPIIPAGAQVCGGAACNDNVGVCRMNPSKPDKINKTDLAPAMDTYLCYTQAGTWTKYTVAVAQAGTYAVGGYMAVPNGGAANISFSGPGSATTGNVTLPVTDPVMLCGGGEQYHCWQERDGLGTVTFTQAGTYLMTLTQVGRFNADNFTFTKM